MNEWVDFYAKVSDSRRTQHFDDNDISTEYPLMLKVMANGNGYVKFPNSSSQPKAAASPRSRSTSTSTVVPGPAHGARH